MGLAYALFASSFFLPAANRQYWGLIWGWQAAHFTAAAVFGYVKSGLEKVLLGQLPSDNLYGLGYTLMLSGNLYMCVAPWILSQAERRRLFAIRIFNIVVIVGALLPLLAPAILPEIHRKDLLVGYYAWALSLVTMLVATFIPKRKTVEGGCQSNGSLLVIVTLLLALSAPAARAQAFNDVQYLCADWGPAMTLPKRGGEKPRFSDREEEIYFLKQVTSFRREKLPAPDSSTASRQRDVWTRRSIYLCKMKPDGSEKAEIKELWRNPNYPIDLQGQATWMDINETTRKIALAITFAGNDITGLWTMNLDGTDLKRIITPENTEKYLQAINHPSWTPDAQYIVFEEELRGMNPNRFNIARCDPNGRHVERLLEAGTKEQYMQPCVSPDGKLMAFAKYPDGYPGQRWIWLAGVDGTNPHPLTGKQSPSTWGDWPAWSPDGKKIYAVGAGIIEAATGKTLLRKGPRLISPQGEVLKEHSTVVMAHWGRKGLLCSGWGVGITAVDENLEIQHAVAASSTEEIKP